MAFFIFTLMVRVTIDYAAFVFAKSCPEWTYCAPNIQKTAWTDKTIDYIGGTAIDELFDFVVLAVGPHDFFFAVCHEGTGSTVFGSTLVVAFLVEDGCPIASGGLGLVLRFSYSTRSY